MMKSLITVLLLATSVAAGMESIMIIGTPHLEATHAIYLALNGTFSLSASGVEGFENAYISHLILDGNLTSLSSMSPDRSTLSSARSLDLAYSKRAPINYKSFTCATVGQYGDGSLFTVAQEQFIAGTACNAFATITPAIWGVAGLVVTNAVCKFQYYNGVCNVAVTVGAAFAGQYIQPAFQQACYASYNAIEARCGLPMGSASITTTADNQDYRIDLFGTSQDTSGICDPPNPCFSITCGSTLCIPG